jgi:hypothetical protein
VFTRRYLWRDVACIGVNCFAYEHSRSGVHLSAFGGTPFQLGEKLRFLHSDEAELQPLRPRAEFGDEKKKLIIILKVFSSSLAALPLQIDLHIHKFVQYQDQAN